MSSSRSDGFDAVVVGAGHNGLIAAITLAEAGRKVLLLEANDRIGGALRTEALTLPGFVHDVGAAVLPMARASAAFRTLQLERDGLEWAYPGVQVAHPLEGKDAVLVHRDVEATARALGVDAGAWRALIGATVRGGDSLVDTLMAPLDWPKAPFAAVRYGVPGLMPVTLLARAAFRTDDARAMFAGMAAHAKVDLGRLITSGFGMLMAALAHSVGWPVVVGGSERLAEALERRFIALGGEIRTGVRVHDLAELPPARSVLLNLTPRQTLAIAADRLPPGYRARLERFRQGPGVFKVDWALDAPIPWTDARVAQAGTVHVCGGFADVVASERATSLGRLPDRPYVLAVQPTAADPSRAPAGKHVFWAYCHVPNGCEEDRTELMEAQVERFAPGFRERILARHVMTPKALEAWDANLVGGDVNGGAADFGQFLARPVLKLRPWATPVKGLYLCGASTPPGGGVHGTNGLRAAKLALRQT